MPGPIRSDRQILEEARWSHEIHVSERRAQREFLKGALRLALLLAGACAPLAWLDTGDLGATSLFFLAAIPALFPVACIILVTRIWIADAAWRLREFICELRDA